jgi:hypothetical protein
MAGENTIGLLEWPSFLEVHETIAVVFPFIRHQSCDFLRQLVAEWVFLNQKKLNPYVDLFLLISPFDFIVLQFGWCPRDSWKWAQLGYAFHYNWNNYFAANNIVLALTEP